jgi:hypothetical protein
MRYFEIQPSIQTALRKGHLNNVQNVGIFLVQDYPSLSNGRIWVYRDDMYGR